MGKEGGIKKGSGEDEARGSEADERRRGGRKGRSEAHPEKRTVNERRRDCLRIWKN